MKQVPIYFDGEIGTEELRRVLEAGGLHVRTLGGRLVASRIPPFVRREVAPPVVHPTPTAKVVPIVAPLLKLARRGGAR